MRYNARVDLRKLLKGLFWIALFLGIIGGVLRLLVLKLWVVPDDDPVMGASIAPSLAPGDVVLLFHSKRPGFGELVRCVDPDEPRRWVIGRIAAEGGDTVVVQGDRININGKVASIEHSCAQSTVTVNDPNTGSPVEQRCDVEALGTVAHMRATRATDGIAGPEPLKRSIQSGFVFLVSDNRYYPNDSRVYGPVDINTCDSRIIFRIWSAKGFSDEPTRFVWIN